MRNRTAERRALYETILSDPAATHSERLRADERLAELDAVDDSRTAREDLPQPGTPEYEQELAAFNMPAASAVALGPNAVEPPVDQRDAEEVVRLQARLIERLEARVVELEAAVRRASAGRALPAPQSELPR